MTEYDVIIIGGGPGGYTTAIRAAKNNLKVALIEANQLGGTCLNHGCIPSKIMLQYSKMIDDIEKANQWGIETELLKINITKMLNRKDAIISTLRNGIESLLKTNKVKLYYGEAKLTNHKDIIVTTNEGETLKLKAAKVIIATGSKPAIPPIKGLNEIQYFTTDSIFSINRIPKSLAIIGGGVIGVELADVFSSLGTKVTIIELDKQILPTEDEHAVNIMRTTLEKKRVSILTEHQVIEIQKNQNDKTLNVLVSHQEKNHTIQVEEILVATGRKPNIGVLENFPLEMDGPFIKVNSFLQTSDADIFAIGDVIGNEQLAHVAITEGMTAALNLNKLTKKMNYNIVPKCIYTYPQIASVGKTEKELVAQHIPYQKRIYPLTNNGMAVATDETNGFVKVMIDEKYGEILGTVIVAANAAEMISQLSAYMYLEGTIDELATMIQPHPSISELFFEVANSLM